MKIFQVGMMSGMFWSKYCRNQNGLESDYLSKLEPAWIRIHLLLKSLAGSFALYFPSSSDKSGSYQCDVGDPLLE